MTEYDIFRKSYRARYRRYMLIIALLFVAAFVSILITLGFGVYEISLFDSVKTFFDHIFGNPVNRKDDLYVWDVRLPRAIGAAFIA